MIIMPIWVVEERESEYVVLFGSEPQQDAKKEIIPKKCVKNIIYAPMIHDSGHKFAMVSLNYQNIPENIRSRLENKP